MCNLQRLGHGVGILGCHSVESIDLQPVTSVQTVIEDQSAGPFLYRAGQIWVVPLPRSWDVQWIQSAQINRALFSHFFAAAEPADNSGGRAGGPWRQWTRPVEADILATASSPPTSLTPTHTPPSLTNLTSFIFLLSLSLWRLDS